MRSRLNLHNKLASILGNPNLYYQQPENMKMKYPCVLYNQEVGNVIRGSNKVYNYRKKYSITFMYTADNENIILDMLNTFEYCELEDTYVVENLYHYIFTLYY